MRKLFAVMVVATALVAGACSACEDIAERAAEEAIERAAGDAGADIDLDFGGNASIPDAFPSDFPLPSGAEPVFSTSASTGDGQGASVWFRGGGSDADLEAFFNAELASGGWTVENTFSQSGQDGDVTVIAATNGTHDAIVYLGRGGPAAAFDENFAFFVTVIPSG